MLKTGLYWILCALCLFSLVACQQESPAPGAPAEPEAAIEVEETAAEVASGPSMVYLCDCGDECDCSRASGEAGPCGCGKERAAHQVLEVAGSEVKVCTCGAECSCEINAEDPAKCGCGHDVKTVNLEGSGLYACACGAGCCPVVRAEPGNCDCGNPLAQL